MQIGIRLLPASIVLLMILDGTHPKLVRADPSGCPGCPTNSPTVNPFPVRGLRWGTAEVLEETTLCPKPAGGAFIAIAEIPPNSKLHGYQLVVVDRTNTTICKETELTGIKFVISKGWEPYVIQQIAKTSVKRDLSNGKVREEDRLLYYIAAAADPDESLCMNNRISSDRFYKRWWRTAFKRRGPSFKNYPPPQISKTANDVFSVPENTLEKFALVIPDAAYTGDGIPVNPGDYRKDLKPIPKGKPEWFELACAGGALAHTELSGLVEPGERKEVRTAALRMFLAKYNTDHDTVEGVPIEYFKHRKGAQLPSDKFDSIEAQWDENGALCVSHSISPPANRTLLRSSIQKSARIILKDILLLTL
jgi:ADYC domain